MSSRTAAANVHELANRRVSAAAAAQPATVAPTLVLPEQRSPSGRVFADAITGLLPTTPELGPLAAPRLDRGRLALTDARKNMGWKPGQTLLGFFRGRVLSLIPEAALVDAPLPPGLVTAEAQQAFDKARRQVQLELQQLGTITLTLDEDGRVQLLRDHRSRLGVASTGQLLVLTDITHTKVTVLSAATAAQRLFGGGDA